MSVTLTPPPARTAGRMGDAPVWRVNSQTTPGRLWLAFGAICLSLAVLWLVADASISRTRQAIQTVGRDAVPSIVAAQQIRADMADMDASTANVFISTGDAVFIKQKQDYEDERQAANDQLISAAQNITYGEAERKPILAITGNLETYSGLVKAARTKGLPYGIKDLLAASAIMHTQLIPEADALDKVNFDHLNEAYTAARASAARTQIVLYFFGALALVVLAATQVYLTRRTHRILNAPLALATFFLAVFVGGLSAGLAAESEQLRAAKADCFDSIHALWKARSVAYDANGDESLYLLGPATAGRYDQSFHEKAALLADVPLTDALLSATASGVVPTFQGSLGDELRNITFPGEHDAATETLRDWGQYLTLDKQIRSLETSGQHKQAVALCTGTAPGQSDYAFAQFDAALGKTLGINQDQFDLTVAGAFAGLRFLPLIAAVSILVIAVLAWLGLAPRIREYQG